MSRSLLDHDRTEALLCRLLRTSPAHAARTTARRLVAAECHLRDAAATLAQDPQSALAALPGRTRLDAWRAERRLRAARRLVVDSYYVCDPDGDEFEGFIDLGDGLFVPVTIASRSWATRVISDPLADDDLVDGAIFADTMFLDVDHLSPARIERAIGTWYAERYRWTPGHWTQPAGLVPAVDMHAVAFATVDTGSVPARPLDRGD